MNIKVLYDNSTVSFDVGFRLISSATEFSNRFRFPFDTNTHVGYIIAFSFQATTWFFILVNTTGLLCFLVGLSRFTVLFIDEIQSDLYTLNESVKNNVDTNKLKKELSETIRFYTDIKQLSY